MHVYVFPTRFLTSRSPLFLTPHLIHSPHISPFLITTLPFTAAAATLQRPWHILRILRRIRIHMAREYSRIQVAWLCGCLLFASCGVAGRTLGLVAGFCLTPVSVQLKMCVAQQLSSLGVLLEALGSCPACRNGGPSGSRHGTTRLGRPHLAKAKGRVAAVARVTRAREYSRAHNPPPLEKGKRERVTAVRDSPAHNPPPLEKGKRERARGKAQA